MTLNIDMGSGSGDGLQGPFIDFKARVTDHAPAKSWLLRSKPDGADSYQVTNITDAFAKGVVIDVEGIQLGWEKPSPMGTHTPPERSWAPTPNLSAFPRPSDEKRVGDDGKARYVWKEVFAVRVAIGGGQAATWSQNAFGAYSGMRQIVALFLQGAPSNPGKLPVVKVVGYRAEANTQIPTFEIAGWVDRPDCLKGDAPQIDMAQPAAAPTEQPAPAPAPAAQPAPAAAVPADLSF